MAEDCVAAITKPATEAPGLVAVVERNPVLPVASAANFALLRSGRCRATALGVALSALRSVSLSVFRLPSLHRLRFLLEAFVVGWWLGFVNLTASGVNFILALLVKLPVMLSRFRGFLLSENFLSVPFVVGAPSRGIGHLRLLAWENNIA